MARYLSQLHAQHCQEKEELQALAQAKYQALEAKYDDLAATVEKIGAATAALAAATSQRASQ